MKLDFSRGVPPKTKLACYRPLFGYYLSDNIHCMLDLSKMQEINSTPMSFQ